MKMNIGTRSLLFGVHQFIWHPITVYLGWVYCYKKLPTIRETICIIVHDWGYWGCQDMDGGQGTNHPILGGKIAVWLFGDHYRKLCVFHSRHFAKVANEEQSRLCWADKSSFLFDPKWFYLFRAWLSGELREYLQMSKNFTGQSFTLIEWHQWYRDKVVALVNARRGDCIPYQVVSNNAEHNGRPE